MFRTRTKQVNSYGRRGSRIINISDPRDRESVDSASSLDLDTPPPHRIPKRENAIIVSPAKSRVRRPIGSSRSPGVSTSVHKKNVLSKVTKQAKLESSIRQPLTPLRSNGISPNVQPFPSAIKGKSKASAIRPARTSLKPRSPVIAVDIVVLDNDGNTLTQERRLSHTEVQPNPVHTATRNGKRTRKTSPTPPPIPITDDSDAELVPPKRVTKRSIRRPRAIVISSDESDTVNKRTIRKKPPVPLARPHSRSPAPYRKFTISEKLPNIRPRIPLDPPETPAGLAPSLQPGPTTVPPCLAPSLPIPKPRQLTPIRRSSSRSGFRRPPPTPSTPTEADLSLDLAQLDLSDATEIDDLAPAQSEYLIPLLTECAQTSPYEFSAFIETFPFDPVAQSSVDDEDARFRKIGEASYSEVFGIGDVVLKIIPIRSEDESMHPGTAEIPAPSDANDVLKEIIVTREIGEICDKFVKLLKIYVVRGRYPSLLLDLWDEYNERKGSESIRPDSFGLTQIYAIIILPNGGPDLESFALKNISKSGWHQACGVFWQVARALEQVENLVQFEHRDLHWGQILVKSVPVKKSTKKNPMPRVPMDDSRFGVKVTIIDLGLSRMSTGDVVEGSKSKVYWTPFDNEIFEGEGDYQYDIYRMMRNHIGDTWKSYHPLTNVMWLHYLVTKLLHEKRIKCPGGKKQAGETRVAPPTGYDEQECYDCLVQMERLLSTCVASVRKGQKGRRKTVAPSNGPKSARDVIVYGMQQGWLNELLECGNWM
ncbi:hypothetical protein JVU11DRAFT_1579 [Chiua virens]|nr:hypothetical protein JVU11DRAFT_1579 [Chiua virens]